MQILSRLAHRYRYSVILLKQLVVTDFKLRYQGSVLGYVWSLLRPLFMFVILYQVFVNFLQIGDDVPHFPVYLLLGIVLWNLFAEITNNCVGSIVERGEIIRKINFPKYVIVISVAFSALINLFLNLLVVAVFLAVTHVEIGWGALLVPLFVAEIFVFALSVGFILSAVFVRLRDINHIWEVVLQAAFYATPIIYPLTKVTDRWPEVGQFLLLSPVAQAIQDIRYYAVTTHTQTLNHLSNRWYEAIIPYVIVVVTMIVAIVLFKKRSPYFAEEV